MARTTEMRLIELMVLKQDISSVIEYSGKKGSFQFQSKFDDSNKKDIKTDSDNPLLDLNGKYYEQLSKAAVFLGVELDSLDLEKCLAPTYEDVKEAGNFLTTYNDLCLRITATAENATKVNDAYKEAMAFSNLKVSYSELDNLSFLSLKIGKIIPSNFDSLKEDLQDNAVVVPLGEDKSHILVASSKKGRFALESVLKNYDFVPMEIPQEFKGVPSNILDSLRKNKFESDDKVKELEKEKENFTETHKDILNRLVGSFSIGMQIVEVQKKLESTELVYKITGWIPFSECNSYMNELDEMTEGRIAMRQFEPQEVPSIMSKKEQVPVKLTHGKFVKSFERMIFSYGSPVYGTIDPTPFIAIFFTVLFGIMFGDLGQGLVFLLVGILMAAKVIKVGGWNKFAPIFMAIGISSSIIGLLTGEFFSNETLLEPFAMWVTGLFGTPHAPILKLMPSSDPSSITAMFGVFGVAVGIGFIINTIGLVINIVNNIILKKYSEAFFGKNGLAGALFFWYVVILILRIFLFKHAIATYDWIVICVTLFFAAFAEPFERKLEGKSTLFENGVGSYIISGFVELIEVISNYLSNSVSFVRVGAFALSHAVLDVLMLTLTEMCGSIGGIFVLIAGNAIIIVLEGMIVAIQVIRLQYYEFFSKFFHETGKEFKPFKFEYVK